MGILQDIRHGFIFSLWLNGSSAYASPIKCRRFRGFRAPQRPNLVDSVGCAFPQTLRPPPASLALFFFLFSPLLSPFTARSNRTDIMFRPSYKKKIDENCFRDSHNYSFLRSIKLHPILVLTSHLRTRLLHKRERKKKKKKELVKKNNLLQFRSTRSITTMRQDYSH